MRLRHEDVVPGVATGVVDIDEERLTLPATVTGPVVVLFEDRYVWSFTPERDGEQSTGGWQVPWPAPLAPLLDGTTAVRIEGQRDGAVHFDEVVAFRGSPRALSVVDRHGVELAVDRAGHLARVFGSTEQATRDAVVAGTARALRDLREHIGIDAHLSYGALLGAVRGGRMIDHDSDTDLAYLSRHAHPADVVRESYRIERELRLLGWKVVRMSGADLKLFLPLDDGRSVHVDVFAGFHVGETYYQLGGRSGPLDREALTPASTVRLEGTEVAGPADPERVLEFLYGPGWREPDASFRSVDPQEGLDRLDGWLRGTRTDVVEWNELFRHQRARLPRTPSGFARWVDARLPADADVVELGSGNGRDAVHFARRGRRVSAYDYSGAAVRHTRRRLSRVADRQHSEEIPEVGVLVLNDLRSVLSTAAGIARTERPPHLYARELLGCLDVEARSNLWLLCATALRRGGSLLVEFLAPWSDAHGDTHVDGLVDRVDPAVITAEIEESGGRVVYVAVGLGEDFRDRSDPAVARLEARWDHTDDTPGHREQEIHEMAAPQGIRTLTRLPAWLRELHRSVEENRRLNRRVAELTDVVAELLVPLADRDDERARELLRRYRETSFAP